MSSDNDILRPKALVLPRISESVRDTLQAEIGSIIYNNDTNQLDYCVATAASAGSWETIGTTA